MDARDTSIFPCKSLPGVPLARSLVLKYLLIGPSWVGYTVLPQVLHGVLKQNDPIAVIYVLVPLRTGTRLVPPTPEPDA